MVGVSKPDNQIHQCISGIQCVISCVENELHDGGALSSRRNCFFQLISCCSFEEQIIVLLEVVFETKRQYKQTVLSLCVYWLKRPARARAPCRATAPPVSPRRPNRGERS